MSFIRDRSITRPSSHTAFPDTCVPPPRTAKTNPCSLAKVIDWITSSASLHRTITAGLVDHRVPDSPCLVVLRVFRSNEFPMQPVCEPDKLLVQCRQRSPSAVLMGILWTA